MEPAYKFLNISQHNIISDELYNYISNYSDLLNNPTKLQSLNYVSIRDVLFYCPMLKDWLDLHNFEPTIMAVILVESSETLSVHQDCNFKYFRILWPVRNCEGSETRFHRVDKKDKKMVVSKNEGLYIDFPSDQEYEVVDKFTLTSPVVFNTSLPHSVHPNKGADGIRISFTIGFKYNLPISRSIEAWVEFGY
jgi:hypothetical protein